MIGGRLGLLISRMGVSSSGRRLGDGTGGGSGTESSVGTLWAPMRGERGLLGSRNSTYSGSTRSGCGRRRIDLGCALAIFLGLNRSRNLKPKVSFFESALRMETSRTSLSGLRSIILGPKGMSYPADRGRSGAVLMSPWSWMYIFRQGW
jgi:hypothetical protein